MTEKQLAAIVRGIMPVVRQQVEHTVAARVSALEQQLSAVGELREKMLVVETKSMQPPDLSEVRERLVAVETRQATISPTLVTELRASVAMLEARVADDSFTKELGGLRERVAVIEVRPVVPGPPGDPGPPGKDGAAGAAGLTYQGVYQEGKSYELGDLATWAGATWHCNEATETKPGDGSKAWTLMVKRGRDGRDGVDAPGALPVVSVGRR